MINWDQLVQAPLQRIFSQAVLFTPVISQPDAPAFTGRGIWSSQVREVALENGGVLSTNEFHLGIRLADFTVPLQQEDQVAVGAVAYIIGDILIDGQGGADLHLRQVSQ